MGYNKCLEGTRYVVQVVRVVMSPPLNGDIIQNTSAGPVSHTSPNPPVRPSAKIAEQQRSFVLDASTIRHWQRVESEPSIKFTTVHGK